MQQLCKQQNTTSSPGDENYRPLVGGFAAAAYEATKDSHYNSLEEAEQNHLNPPMDETMVLSPTTNSSKEESPSGSSGEKSSDELLSELLSLSSTFSDMKPADCNPSPLYSQRVEDQFTKSNTDKLSQLKVAIEYEMQQSTSPPVSPRESKLERPSTENLLAFGQKKVSRSDSVTSPQNESQSDFTFSPRKSQIPLLKKVRASPSNTENLRISMIPTISSPSPVRRQSPYKKSKRVSRIPFIK